MCHVLMVGEDPALLSVRALVLSKAKVQVSTLLSYEASPGSWMTPCDLIMICHSTAADRAAELLHDARLHRADTPVIVLQSVLGRTPLADGLVPVISSDPVSLLEYICGFQPAGAECPCDAPVAHLQS